MDVPFVTVIIPVFNDSKRLLSCLQSLYCQTYPYSCYEVIVVDNGSTENIYSICHQFPNVRCLHESKCGSYAARNCGVRAAKGEILAFTDSDCIPAPDWIEAGVRSLYLAPNIGIVAGHIEFFYAQSQPNPVEYMDRLMHLNQRFYAEKGYAATGNAFTWAWCFSKVGMFNDELLSLGDCEWGMRVSGLGYRVVYSSDVYVQHPARVTLKALLKKVRLQARHKPLLKPWKVTDLLRQMLPMGLIFYWNLLRDRTLTTLKAKLRFALVIHYVKYAIAWEMTQFLLSEKRIQLKTQSVCITRELQL